MPIVKGKLTAKEISKSGKFTLDTLARQFKRAGGFIKAAIKAYAPKSGQVEEIWDGYRLRTVTVYPEVAIEAALRREHWFPIVEKQVSQENLLPPSQLSVQKSENNPKGAGRNSDPSLDIVRDIAARNRRWSHADVLKEYLKRCEGKEFTDNAGRRRYYRTLEQRDVRIARCKDRAKFGPV